MAAALAELDRFRNRQQEATKQAAEVRTDISNKIDVELAEFSELKKSELPKFNQMVKEKAVDAIMIKKEVIKP